MDAARLIYASWQMMKGIAMFKIRNPFKPQNVNVAKISALKQLQVIEVLQRELKISNGMVTEFRNDLVEIEKYAALLMRQKKNIHEAFCSLVKEGDLVEDDLRLSRLEVIELQDQQLKDKREIEALKAIVSNLRKQKVYPGQKFYNQEDHRAPTVYLCARWNDWYVVRQSNQLTPILITAEQWKETYGHLVVMPQMNSNIKNLS